MISPWYSAATYYNFCSIFFLSICGIIGLHAADVQDDCSTEHYQTKFCRADFVIKTQLKHLSEEQLFKEWLSVDMKIKNQIKIGDSFQQISDAQLGKLLLPESVYAKVQNKTKYIISGSLQKINDQLHMSVSHCDWVQPWAELTHRIKSALRKQKYAENCQCQISSAEQPDNKLSCSTSSSASNTSSSTTDAALFAQGNSASDLKVTECYRKHAHCRMTGGGQESAVSSAHFRHIRSGLCKWSSNKELDRCVLCARDQMGDQCS